MILPVGQSEVLRVPWVTGVVVLVCLALFLTIDAELPEQAPAPAEDLAQAAEYWREHAYLDVDPEIMMEVGRGLATEERRKLYQDLRHDSYQRWPEDEEMRRAQQEVLDSLSARALASDTTPRVANAYTRWGLVPADPGALAFFTHPFLHGSWAHLLMNLLILFLAGAALEERWGHLRLAAIIPFAGALTGAAALVAVLGSPTPLFGSAGIAACVVGAALAHYRLKSIRCYYALGIDRKGPIQGSFRVPALSLLPLWLASAVGQVWLLGLEVPPLVAAQATGLVFGAAATLVFARLAGQERPGLSGERPKRERSKRERPKRERPKRERPKLGSGLLKKLGEKAKLARESKRAQKSAPEKSESQEPAPEDVSEFAQLEAESEANPGDPDAARAFWEAALAAGRPEAAAPAMLRAIHYRVSRGEAEEAARTWVEITAAVPNAYAYPTLLVRLIPALSALGDNSQAARALRQAIDPRNRGLTLQNALRAVHYARELDPQLCVEAARRALDLPDVPADARSTLQSIIEQGGPVATASPGPDGPITRAGLAPPTPVPEAPQVSSAAGGPRFSGLKIVEGKPAKLAENGLFIEVAAERIIELKYARVEALSAAMVVRSLGQNPEIVIDLVLNWTATGDEALRIVRLHSDGFDPTILVGEQASLEDAYRTLLDKLLTLTRATPLPDEESARGRPMRVFSDLETYQREVLEVDS